MQSISNKAQSQVRSCFFKGKIADGRALFQNTNGFFCDSPVGAYQRLNTHPCLAPMPPIPLELLDDMVPVAGLSAQQPGPLTELSLILLPPQTLKTISCLSHLVHGLWYVLTLEPK